MEIRASDFAPQLAGVRNRPLDSENVSQALKNLYATGLFNTLRADVQPEAAGVTLIFAGQARLFAGTVTVKEIGKALSPSALAGSARLPLGDPLTTEGVQGAARRITSMLKSEGYYESRVQPTVSPVPPTQIANVRFLVKAGPPATLAGVDLTGSAAIPPAQLIAAAHWRHGIHLTQARITHGLEKIHASLAQRGYWAATASVERRIYNPAKNTETLEVNIHHGPLVRVRIEGPHISSSQLHRFLPVYKEGLTDDLSLDAGAKWIESYFQKQGYFSCKLRWQRPVNRPGEIEIIYVVTRGPRSAFVGYTFRGNRSIPSDALTPLVTLQAASFPSPLSGVFTEDRLENSVNAIEGRYRDDGFLQARVVPRLSYQNAQLSVIFDIHEGPRTTVDKLAIRGVGRTTADALRAGFQSLPGKPYSPAVLAHDRNAALTYLTNHGFQRATVTIHVVNVTPERVNLTYNVTTGPQETIRSIQVIGNERTHTPLILRTLTFRPNQPVSEELFLQSQRRLYNLGLFDNVEIAPENPGGSFEAKNILVNVTEAARWTVGYGFGLDVQRLGGNQPTGQLGASPRLSLDLTRINVGGRDQTFSLRGRLSDLETGAEASYLISNLFRRPKWSLHFDASAYRTSNVLTFTSTIEQASLALEKQISPSTFVLGRYNYEFVSVSNLRINPLEIPLFSVPVRDAGPEFTFVHDTRDNPENAARGTYTLVDARFASRSLASQANYARFFGQNSSYYQLTPHFVFARNLQFGVEWPYGARHLATVPGEPNLTTSIPFPDEFFAGGADSIRAFSLNQAGPRDSVTGYPIGGNALFINSFELRMNFRNGRYGLVLFNDAGNVYSGIDDMRLLKFTQTSPLDLNYTAEAGGLGLRYNTPIGPIRFDVSYVPNPPQFEVMQVHRGATTTEVQQLQRFQYFISIGQSF
jgi:outer membrane protein insertion porin family